MQKFQLPILFPEILLGIGPVSAVCGLMSKQIVGRMKASLSRPLCVVAVSPTCPGLSDVPAKNNTIHPIPPIHPDPLIPIHTLAFAADITYELQTSRQGYPEQAQYIQPAFHSTLIPFSFGNMGGRVKRQLYLFIPLFHSSIQFCNKFLTKKRTFGSNMKIANLCILVTILIISTNMIMVIIINIMSVQEANPLICFSVNNPPSPAGCSAHHHHPPCARRYYFHLHHRQSTTYHHQHHHLPCASHYYFSARHC